jgi:hypothetical protein
MKKLCVFLFISAGLQMATAQFVYTWDAYHLTFKSPFKLDRYTTESPDVFGSDNDDYAVDISGFPLSYFNSYSKTSDLKSAAFDVAAAYGFVNTRDGGALPLITKGYYVITESDPSEGASSAIVILVLGIDEKRNTYIEGTIYCYNRNQAKGIEVAKTFSFTP